MVHIHTDIRDHRTCQNINDGQVVVLIPYIRRPFGGEGWLSLIHDVALVQI